MSKYMIHTCPDRRWYVDEYLIPSMLDQGIRNEDIDIYDDQNHDGHLKAFLKSCQLVTGQGTWHLQDDIIIASNFKIKTQAYDEGIVCGFCNNYSEFKEVTGYAPVTQMWYSMPCIRIPDTIINAFVIWAQSERVQKRYAHCFLANKHSDVLFWDYLKEIYPEMQILNLAPNIVNHVDHLIGGSLINAARSQGLKDIMSIYWKEPKSIGDLERRLQWREK